MAASTIRSRYRWLSPTTPLTPVRRLLGGVRLSRAMAGGPVLPVTFPVTPLRSRVRVALGADLSADPLTWPWEDITDKVRWDVGVGLTVGRRDEAAQGSTGQGQMKLDNRDSRFTRRNPTGPYFGLLSKNTPIWAEVDAGSGWKTRMEMFVNEWPKTWADKSATDSTVTIGCSGVLRRLVQGRRFQSPLRRAIRATSPAVHWPMEDDAGATAAGPATVGGISMFTSGVVVFAGATDLVGAAQAADLSAGMLTGIVTGVSATSWHAEFVFKSTNFVAAAFGRILTASTGFGVYRLFPPNAVGQRWSIFITNVDATVITTTLTGSTLATSAFAGTWHHFAVSSEQVGSNVITRMYVDGVLEATDTSAGTLAAPNQVLANQNYGDGTDPIFFGPIALGSGTTISDAAAAVDGYAGEMAHERLGRLCSEEAVVFETAASTSPTMGPQGTDTLLGLLREAEAVGGGVLYEKRWGLAYQSLRERYNAPVALALDIALGHLAEIPEPADDDQRTRNLFTATRPTGSEYTAEETDGDMGTGAQGPGVYDDGAPFNVESDSQLPSQAGWRIHLGTTDEDRWPDLALNFAHNPELIGTWTSLPSGARVTVANPLPQMPPDPPDLVVEGHSERWDSKRWSASLNCSPASVYRTHVVASTDGNLGRVDNASSYLTADATSTATSLTVAQTGAPWRVGSTNFDIAVGGERMTVTNISGAMQDTFTRITPSGSWGGGEKNTWVVDLGTAADFSVNGSVGIMSHPAAGSNHSVLTDLGGPTQYNTTYFRMPALPVGVGATAIYELRGRWIDNNNHYAARVAVDTAGLATFDMRRRSSISGSATYTGSTFTLDPTHTYGLALYANGSDLRAKVWDATTSTEPGWMVQSLDSGQATGNLLCLLTVAVSVTAVPFEFWLDRVEGVLLDGAQTFTVVRSVNSIVKAQPATVGPFRTKVSLWKPGVYAL